jgi:hypothetical protein
MENNNTDPKDTGQDRRHVGRWERYKQSWRKTAGWNKIMVGFTAVIAISTTSYACYERKQLGVMAGQLKQMEGTSTQTDQMIWLIRQQLAQLTKQATDTHELAAQAKDQTESTKDIADRALTQATATNELARQAKRSADSSERAINEASRHAQEALDESIKAYVLDQRPWIGVYEAPIIHWDKDGFRMQVVFENSGKTPAIKIINLGNTAFVSPVEIDGCDNVPPQHKGLGALAPHAVLKLIEQDTPQHPDYGGSIYKSYDEIMNGTKYLYVCGILFYSDTRGLIGSNGKPYTLTDKPKFLTTTFCLEYDRSVNAFGRCAQYNDMQ